MNAANIILQQIRTMDKMALWDWGCMKFRPQSSNNGLTLTLKSSGYVPWKGFIAITLDEGADLYNIEFYRMRKPRINRKKDPMGALLAVPVKKVDKSVDGVYFDQLVEIIDRQVLKR